MVQAVLVNGFFRSALFPLIVIVLLVYLASQTLMADDPSPRHMGYAEAQSLLREHPERIDEITLRPNERTARVRLADGSEAKTPSSSSSGWWWYGLAPFVLVIGLAIYLQSRSRTRAEEDLTARVRNRSTA